MTKTYRCFAALALAAASSQAFALGLGTIVVKSQLDEPLLAEIPVIGASPEEASGLQARLAAPNEIERAGVDASRGSAPVELQVVETKDGRTVIRVTTRSAVHDPMMAFLVNVTWSSGQVLREYKVTFAGSSSGSASTVTQATPEPERAAPAAPPPPPKPKAAPAEASKPKAVPAETKPAAAPHPAEPPAKPVAAEPKPQPAKSTPAPAPAPVPAKPVATEPKAAPPAAPPPKPVAAEAKPVPAPAKAPPPPAPPASPAADTKASAPQPKTEAPAAPQSSAAAKPVAPPPAGAPKPAAPPPASPSAASAPVDPHAELERAKTELAAKEAESNALRARLAELEKSQPANRERLEQENKKLEDAAQQLDQMAKQVDAQQQAVAQTAPAGSAPPPAAPVPAGSGDSEPAPATVTAPAGSTSGTQGADAVAPARPAPGSEPSPPPSPEFRWYDDWLIPGGIGIALLLVASLALMRMRRGRVAAAPSFAGALASEPEFDLSETEPAFGDAAADEVDFSAVAPVDTEEQFNLLRLLYLRGDAIGFEQAARHIYEQDPDPDLWRRVAEMGRMVSPDNALFADAGGGIKRMEFDLPELSTPVPAEAMIDSEPEVHELRFEPEHTTPPPPIAEPPVTDASERAGEHEAIPFERVEAAAPEPDPWADDSATVAMPVHEHPTHEPAPPVTADERPVVADVDPESGTDGGVTPAASAPPVSPPATSTASRPTSAVEDPVDTKLELAIAYLEMGDADAARHMLDEVMDEGDSRQKAEALKLRAEVGGGQRSA